MQKEYISGQRGYSIPCVYNIKGNEKAVCIIVHGFGSSKDSTTATMMLNELPLLGIGAIALDLPAHGDSGVDGGFLRLDNCTADLAAVEARARGLAQEPEIIYFGSSFGAYITLIYLAGRAKSNRSASLRRAFLRCAAVSMPRLFNLETTQEQRARLEATGEIILSKDEYGYARDLKITQGFYDDLQRYDAFAFWREGFAQLRMIHGGSDETVPLADAQAFAGKFHVPLTIVPNGDHSLSTPGAPELVLKLASEFFAGALAT